MLYISFFSSKDFWTQLNNIYFKAVVTSYFADSDTTSK